MERVRTSVKIVMGKCGEHAQDLLFTAALAVVSVGLGLERPSLAFIFPGSLICGLLIYGRLGGGRGKG